MTLEELRIVTMRELEEAIESPVFWSAEDVDATINDGYLEMSDACEWLEVYRTVPILHSRPYYDIRTVFSGQVVLTVTRAFHVDTNRWLMPATHGDLSDMYLRWEQIRPDQPWRIIRRGLYWFGYWPISGSENGTVKQYATILPEPLSDADSPGFPVLFHRGLIDYALSELLPQAGEISKGMAAWNRYMAFEQGLADHVHNHGARIDRGGQRAAR